MTRDDERRQLKGGAGTARSPEAARRDEEPHATEHVSKEHDSEHMHNPEEEGLNASEERSPAGTRRAESGFMHKAHEEELGERGTVRGGRGIKHEHVDAEHVIGTGGSVETASAEGETDMASAKANRKEAMEPEREENEQAAMGRERTVAHKNTIGHGERETVAHHTI